MFPGDNEKWCTCWEFVQSSVVSFNLKHCRDKHCQVHHLCLRWLLVQERGRIVRKKTKANTFVVFICECRQTNEHVLWICGAFVYMHVVSWVKVSRATVMHTMLVQLVQVLRRLFLLSAFIYAAQSFPQQFYRPSCEQLASKISPKVASNPNHRRSERERGHWGRGCHALKTAKRQAFNIDKDNSSHWWKSI